MIDVEFGKVLKRPNRKAHGETDKKVVWDAESVADMLERIELGYKPKQTPFYENDKIDWKKGDIAYVYSPEEWDEFEKCKGDIIYFANTYCKLMTDDGYQNISLYDYQVDMLRNFTQYKNNCVLSSRQIGKCTQHNTLINIIRGKFKLYVYNCLNNIKLTLYDRM